MCVWGRVYMCMREGVSVYVCVSGSVHVSVCVYRGGCECMFKCVCVHVHWGGGSPFRLGCFHCLVLFIVQTHFLIAR